MIFKNWYSNYLPFQFPLSWFVMLSIWLSWFFCALALAASLLSSSLLFGKYENYSLTSFLLTFSLLFELLLFWQHQRKAEKIEKLRVLGFIPRCQWALNVELTCIWNYDIFLPRSFWANWVVFLKATQANKKYPSSPFSLLKLFFSLKNHQKWYFWSDFLTMYWTFVKKMDGWISRQIRGLIFGLNLLLMLDVGCETIV